MSKAKNYAESLALAKEAGLTPGSGTYRTYLSRLRSNDLIVESRGHIKASGDLFPEKIIAS